MHAMWQEDGLSKGGDGLSKGGDGRNASGDGRNASGDERNTDDKIMAREHAAVWPKLYLVVKTRDYCTVTERNCTCMRGKSWESLQMMRWPASPLRK